MKLERKEPEQTFNSTGSGNIMMPVLGWSVLMGELWQRC
jgi:hypothetical protein